MTEPAGELQRKIEGWIAEETGITGGTVYAWIRRLAALASLDAPSNPLGDPTGAKAEVPQAPADAEPIYTHLKTGGVYRVLGYAQDESAPDRQMVVYRNTNTHETWVRPAAEFHDGRFALSNVNRKEDAAEGLGQDGENHTVHAHEMVPSAAAPLQREPPPIEAWLCRRKDWAQSVWEPMLKKPDWADEAIKEARLAHPHSRGRMTTPAAPTTPETPPVGRILPRQRTATTGITILAVDPASARLCARFVGTNARRLGTVLCAFQEVCSHE